MLYDSSVHECHEPRRLHADNIERSERNSAVDVNKKCVMRSYGAINAVNARIRVLEVL